MIGGRFQNWPHRPSSGESSTVGVVRTVVTRVKPTVFGAVPYTAHTIKPDRKDIPVPNPIVTKGERGPSKPGDTPFHVVILSARASNLTRCLDAILEREPMLPEGRIVVVDDGARSETEPYFTGIDWVRGLKPFVFARNANLAIQWTGTDVILLNDDACLVTPNGFQALSKAAHGRPDLGVLSAAISGDVGNPNQNAQPGDAIRPEHSKLSFICVYIKAQVIQQLGFLDELFMDYGYEDDDFCLRAIRAGLNLGVYDGCVIDHSHPETSSYRTKPEFDRLIEANRIRFMDKWKGHL